MDRSAEQWVGAARRRIDLPIHHLEDSCSDQQRKITPTRYEAGPKRYDPSWDVLNGKRPPSQAALVRSVRSYFTRLALCRLERF